MVPVPAEFDVVVTTNAGFPLDQNLYQCVKGLSAGAVVVREGGTLICAAECRDGFPDHGSYREVLASQPTPAALLRSIEARPTTVPDQWQAQVQCRVQARARVLLHTRGLTAAELAAAHFETAPDVSAAVRDELARFGRGATVCVLPEGPQTIAYVEAS
jgi:nickel-dependent lactate racemase